MLFMEMDLDFIVITPTPVTILIMAHTGDMVVTHTMVRPFIIPIRL